MIDQWIENLKIGDKVVIGTANRCFSPTNFYQIATIKRLTKTQIIVHHNGVSEIKFSKNTQYLVGNNSSKYIVQLTDKILEENKRYELYLKLKEIPNFLHKNINNIVNSNELANTVEFFENLKNSIKGE